MQPGLRTTGLEKGVKPQNFSNWHRNAKCCAVCSTGSARGVRSSVWRDCTTRYWVQDPTLILTARSSSVDWIGLSLCDWKKKKVKGRKKDICRFCSHYWALRVLWRICATTVGHPSMVLAGVCSLVESWVTHQPGTLWMKEASFWKASCSVVEAKSTDIFNCNK